MASQYTMQKRNLKWFQEDNEQPLTEQRIREGYEPSRLKAGSDGRNVPSVTKAYASESDREFDDMGASKGKKSGKTTVVEQKRPTAKRVIKEEEEFENEDFGAEDAMGGDEGLDIEEPAMEDEFGTGEDTGAVATDDILITVGGVSYKLVPAGDAEGGVEGEEDLLGDEGGIGEDFGDEMAMGAEEDDAQPKFESKKRANKALDKAVEAQAKKLVAQKQMIEKKLAELFTGSYVASDSGEKGPTGGGQDTSFAVSAKANSGKQYTPTVNPKTAFEPETDNLSSPKSRAPSNQTVKTSEARKAEFKKWLAETEKSLNEEVSDAGQDSADFNKNDTEDNLIGDEFADNPLEVSSNGNQIYGENKSRGQKALQESFDFKKLMRGEYK